MYVLRESMGRNLCIRFTLYDLRPLSALICVVLWSGGRCLHVAARERGDTFAEGIWSSEDLVSLKVCI